MLRQKIYEKYFIQQNVANAIRNVRPKWLSKFLMLYFKPINNFINRYVNPCVMNRAAAIDILTRQSNVLYHERQVVEEKLKRRGITAAFDIIGLPPKPEHALEEDVEKIYALAKRYEDLRDQWLEVRRELERTRDRGLSQDQLDTIRRMKEMKVYRNL